MAVSQLGAEFRNMSTVPVSETIEEVTEVEEAEPEATEPTSREAVRRGSRMPTKRRSSVRNSKIVRRSETNGRTLASILFFHYNYIFM